MKTPAVFEAIFCLAEYMTPSETLTEEQEALLREISRLCWDQMEDEDE